MSVWNTLIDFLYPPTCVSCRTGGDWWCEACRNTVERTPGDPCPRCLSFDAGHASCTGTLPFSGVVATGFYHSPPLRRLIADLKYQGVTAAAPSVEAYLRTVADNRSTSLPWSHEPSLCIQPMPLAPARERERGFNQAAWVADRMRVAWGVEGDMVDVLVRQKGAAAQAELEHQHALRSANVKGRFQVSARITQSILLVDDVVTTGSTAAEAARVLLTAGTPRVYLAALAVGK